VLRAHFQHQRVRPEPRGFHNFTILQGDVGGGLLTGTASDSRCVMEITLRKVGRR